MSGGVRVLTGEHARYVIAAGEIAPTGRWLDAAPRLARSRCDSKLGNSTLHIGQASERYVRSLGLRHENALVTPATCDTTLWLASIGTPAPYHGLILPCRAHVSPHSDSVRARSSSLEDINKCEFSSFEKKTPRYFRFPPRKGSSC